MVKIYWHRQQSCTHSEVVNCLSPRYTILLQQPRIARGSVSSQSCAWTSATGSRRVRLNGLISACSNWLVRLGGKSIKKANEKTQDLPSLRTAKFLTSLKKSVIATVNSLVAPLKLPASLLLRIEGRAGQHEASTRTLVWGCQYWSEGWSPLRALWNSLRCRADEEKKPC